MDAAGRSAKKVRRVEAAAEWDDELPEADAESEDAAVAPAQPAPKASQALEQPEFTIEDLEPGAVVLYWGLVSVGVQTLEAAGWRGVISDAFVAIDEFWVCDEGSGEIVHDENGDIFNFKSSNLELVARPPIAPPNPRHAEGAPGGVLLIGGEQQMMKILNHFGTPDADKRHQPQDLLAFPCEKCEAQTILKDACSGVHDGARKLGQELRPDLHVAVRAYHLKEAVRQLGPDLLRMEGFFLLSSVSLPYSWDDIEGVRYWQKKWRRDVCNQIDVGPSARGLHRPADSTPEDTARRVLGDELGMLVSMVLWDPQVQANIRKGLEVDLPLKFTDVNGGVITVLLLPSDTLVTIDAAILCFTEAPDANYLPEYEDEEVAEDVPTSAPGLASRSAVQSRAADVSKPAAAPGPQGKTIVQWEKEQAQFAHLPKLKAGWVRVVSQKSRDIYFFNKNTKEATFDEATVLLPFEQTVEQPLPAGWTKQTSKSTGKSYYFHAALRKSQFDRPTE